MCKGVCERSCSREIALSCPSTRSIQVLLVEEKIWQEFERIMTLQDRANKGETGWQLMQQIA